MRWLPIVVMAFLAAGCGFVPRIGARAATFTVTNLSVVPVTLTVRTEAGVLQGAVLPATLGARAKGEITLFLPPGPDYDIWVNGTLMFPGGDVDQYRPETCAGRLFMEVNVDGSGGIGCNSGS
jgi:hypothetical protein